MAALFCIGSARAADPVPTMQKPPAMQTPPPEMKAPIKVPPGAADAGTPAAAPAPATRPSDHKWRTVEQCKLLPSVEQPQCESCVTRPGAMKHIYRPDYPAGDRCRLDNGMP